MRGAVATPDLEFWEAFRELKTQLLRILTRRVNQLNEFCILGSPYTDSRHSKTFCVIFQAMLSVHLN